MLIRVLSLLLVFLLLMPLLVIAQDPPKHSADDRIYDEVRRKLANDIDVKGAGIDVTVKDGAVTLKGRVHTNVAKDKATKITKKVKGVTSVDNQLTVTES